MSSSHPNRPKVQTVKRPYTMVTASGSYPLSSEDAQRLIATSPIHKASPWKVTLGNAKDQSVEIIAATVGGGPAFIVERK
jgi:hypothetical protein